MQILLIAVLMIAFFGGILSKCNSNHSSTGASFFNVLGFKTKDQIQQEQLNQLLGKYLKNKDSLVGEIEQEMGPLSEAVKNASDKDKNVDLLRLKNLMGQFEDQNVLMIQDGKDLLAYNEKQKKINKKMADQLDLDQFLSRSNQNELIDRQKDILNEIRNNAAVKSDPQLADKVNAAYDKASSRLEQLKQQQEQIQSMRQSSLRDPEAIKEKIEDQKRRNEDQMQANNDRIKDQMERLRDRNRF